jgi:hypothetical protein
MDSVLKGRHNGVRKTHCKRGHEFTDENTYFRDGQRHCKACTRGKCRRQMGWPEHLWYADFKVPAGYAVERATGNIVPAKRAAS